MTPSRFTRRTLAALLPAAVLAPVWTLTAEAATSTVNVSALPQSVSTNGWGPVERNRSNGEQAAGDGRTLQVAGQSFASGLGVHAPSDVRITVPSGCTTFASTVGVDDEVGGSGSVSFQLFSGATKLYDSGLLRGSSPAAQVSVAVRPGTVLRLAVSEAVEGNGMDHADWAGARFLCTTTTTAPTTAPTPAPTTAPTPTPTAAPAVPTDVPVSGLTPTSSTNGWGPVERNRSNGEDAAGDGRTLTVAGETFASGLGVHAPSEVAVTVPAGCTRFSSTVGLDDEVADGGSVVFSVSSGTTKLHESALLRGSSPAARVDVPVTPGSTLRLTVGESVEGTGLDHADWAGARFTCTTDGAAPTAPTTPAPTAPAPTTPAPTTPAPTTPAPTTPAPTTPAPTAPSGSATAPTGVPGAWRSVFADEFSGAVLDASKWSDHDEWQKNGYGQDSAWFPVPHTSRQIESSGGVLTLKNRRGTGLPEGKAFTSAHINTKGKFSIPAGATSYTEARIKAPSAAGTLPGFWLLGNGTSADGGGWPITGEVDILEFANNTTERGAPYFSVWYPKDVYTNAPGTWLNGTHDSHPDTWAKRPGLLDSWHTWGLLRSPQKMELYIDGVLTASFRPNVSYHNQMPLPPMLFTNAQHLRLSMLIGGGWAGSGYSEAQYGEGDLAVDYVRVFTQ